MANVIRVPLVIDTTAADKKLKSSEFKFVKAGTKAGTGFSKGFNSGVSSGLKISTGQILKASAAFIGLSVAISKVGEAATEFREFERGVAEVNSILPKNAKLTEESTQALIDFSAQFGTAQAQQARGFYNVVSAGVKGTAKQLQTLKAANKAAVAGLVDIDTSTTALVSSVNAYAKAGLTATQSSDILFATVKAGQTTFGQLAAALPNVTGLAASLGVEFADLNGVIAQLTTTGLTTSQSVTGIKAALSGILKPTADAVKEAERLGIEFTTTALKSKGLSGFLIEVAKASKGSADSIARLFGSVEAQNAVLSIANSNLENFQDTLDGIKDSVGATSGAFKELEKSTDFKLKQLDAEFKRAATSLLVRLAPAIGVVTDAIRGFRVAISGDQEALLVRGLNKELERASDNVNNLEKQIAAQKELFALTGDTTRQERLIDLEKQLNAEKEKKLAFETQLKSIESGETFGPSPLPEQEGASPADKIVAEADKVQTAVVGIAPTFSALTEASASANKSIKADLKNLSSAFQGALSGGIGKAFTDVGRALKTGKDGFQAFAEAIDNILADVASAIGDTFIKWGVANLVSGNVGMGSAQIAAGGALKILAGSLGGGGGTGDSGGAPASSGGGQDLSVDDSGIEEQQELERSAPKTAVNITVEGSIFDGDDTPRRIAELISEGGAREGILINDVRSFA